MKRAQITVFVLLGILCIVIITIIFAVNFRPREVLDSSDFFEQSISAEQQITSCMSTSAIEALDMFGKQGAHVYLPENYLELDEYKIGYQYYHGDFAIDRERMSRELGIFVQQALAACLEVYPEMKSTEVPIVNVTIFPEMVEFTLSRPIVVIQDTNRRTVGETPVFIPVRLGLLLDITEKHMNDIKRYPIFKDLDYLNDGIDMDFEIMGDDFFFVFEDKKSVLREESYLLLLAFAFLPREVGPQLIPVPQLNATVGEEFSYTLRALSSSDEVYFNVHSPFFEVDPVEGIIKFKPDQTQIGSHIFMVEVLDEDGYADSQAVILNITGEGTFRIASRNQTAVLGDEWTYAVFVDNPSRVPLTFVLQDAPTAASLIERTVFWTPLEIGIFNFTFAAVAEPETKTTTFSVEVTP